ncbi:MAG TPA: hypothetical protein VL332_07615 [Candidatus Saccharimonadaceae bacterium]|jgi:hypothetical protein|nr:hypothetical protein [Candidatus Saccharimonadaceae bacterium]
MHFLDAWSQLEPWEALRLALPAIALVLAILLPGRRTAALAALLLAIASPVLVELGGLWLRAGWFALWLAIGARIVAAERDPAPDPSARPGGFESGAVGLLLGTALFLLIVAAIARQDLAPALSRTVSYGIALMTLGLIHLMLRRHLQRAMLSLGTLGFGLQLLDNAAHSAQIPSEPHVTSGVLLGTALAAALTSRLAEARAAAAGSVWVSQAHDLHD